MSRKDWSPKEVDCDIKIIRQVDESPDLSYLGAYSDNPAEHSIDRQERGDMERNQYRYFNLGTGEPEYLEQDYERMEAYNRQVWHMTGIIAVTVIELDEGYTEEVRSCGVWGVESDSGDDHLNELGDEEIHALVKELKDRGIKCKPVKAKDVEVELK